MATVARREATARVVMRIDVDFRYISAGGNGMDAGIVVDSASTGQAGAWRSQFGLYAGRGSEFNRGHEVSEVWADGVADAGVYVRGDAVSA
jgi:hypothetical protein